MTTIVTTQREISVLEKSKDIVNELDYGYSGIILTEWVNFKEIRIWINTKHIIEVKLNDYE
jgi:hypothetical protein